MDQTTPTQDFNIVTDQTDLTKDFYDLKGQTVSQLEQAESIANNDLMLFSRHSVKTYFKYGVVDFIVNEKEGEGGDINISLQNNKINHIYIRTLEAGSDTILSKIRYSNVKNLRIKLPPIKSDEPYDYYFHFCWINRIVFPMNEYESWLDRTHAAYDYWISATILDPSGNELDQTIFMDKDFHNDPDWHAKVQHEDCFSVIYEDNQIKVTKYKGVADIVQEDEDKVDLIGLSAPVLSDLGFDDHQSYKLSYRHLVNRLVHDLSSGIDFGTMAFEDHEKYAKLKHKHDYDFTEVFSYYDQTDAHNNMYNLLGIVHLSNALSSNQVSIWMPETPIPKFFRDYLIGELKPLGLDKSCLPAIDVDSPYFDGWVYCDGTQYLRADFPDAWEVFRFGEGGTPETFRVPCYDEYFIKSNPNLPELADDPNAVVQYHNVLRPHYHYNKNTPYIFQAAPGALDITEKSIKFLLPATGPNKKKIAKYIKNEDKVEDKANEDGKDPETMKKYNSPDFGFEISGISERFSSWADLEYLLDAPVNKPHKSSSRKIVHGGQLAKKVGKSKGKFVNKNHYPPQYRKKGEENEVTENTDGGFDYDPVDVLDLTLSAIPGSSKARLRPTYASEPIGNNSDLNGESYPEYHKFPMLVYIGRKAKSK